MAYFAKLDEDNTVLEVHCVHDNELLDENNIEREQKGIDFLTKWSNGHTKWKQTSHNNGFRKTYASVGGKYDPKKDVFIKVKPYPSWVLNEDTCEWEAPIPKPSGETNKFYVWGENIQQWVLVSG